MLWWSIVGSEGPFEVGSLAFRCMPTWGAENCPPWALKLGLTQLFYISLTFSFLFTPWSCLFTKRNWDDTSYFFWAPTLSDWVTLSCRAHRDGPAWGAERARGPAQSNYQASFFFLQHTFSWTPISGCRSKVSWSSPYPQKSAEQWKSSSVGEKASGGDCELWKNGAILLIKLIHSLETGKQMPVSFFKVIWVHHLTGFLSLRTC